MTNISTFFFQLKLDQFSI